MNSPVYLDYAATTPVDERVGETMFSLYSTCFGNASSLHSFGVKSKEILEHSRKRLAGFIQAEEQELFFTSSGTESNNLALKGVAFSNQNLGKHIIVSTIEHDCILNTCDWLKTQGFAISYLPVDSLGLVNPDSLKKMITPSTIMVSIMHVNNEIGTIQPIGEIGRICRDAGILFHTDACQSFGKVPIDVKSMNIDMMTINAHKIYGPKGVAALYVREGISLTPLLHGGGQESGIRSSTENIPGIAGFVKAAKLCMDEMDTEMERQKILTDHLVERLSEEFENVSFNGHLKHRLISNINFSFSGLEGETIRLLLLLDEEGIAVSAGSACSSNKAQDASHVLKALGKDPFQARGSIRVSIGRFTTMNDIDRLLEALARNLNKLNPIFS